MDINMDIINIQIDIWRGIPRVSIVRGTWNFQNQHNVCIDINMYFITIKMYIIILETNNNIMELLGFNIILNTSKIVNSSQILNFQPHPQL